VPFSNQVPHRSQPLWFLIATSTTSPCLARATFTTATPASSPRWRHCNPPLRIWCKHWRKRTRVQGASLGPAYAHAGFVPLHCPRAKGYRSESPLSSVREVLQALPVPSATHPRYVLDAVCGVPFTANGTGHVMVTSKAGIACYAL
jgi:hypothetical protein